MLTGAIHVRLQSDKFKHRINATGLKWEGGGLESTSWAELVPVAIVLFVMGESDLRRRNAQSTSVSEASGIVGAGWYVPIQLALAVFYEQVIRPHCYRNTIVKEAQWKDIVNTCWKVRKCVFNKRVTFHSFFLPHRCKPILKQVFNFQKMWTLFLYGLNAPSNT